MEFSCREGPVVGGLLGANGQRREATLEENSGTLLDYDELQTAVMEIEAIVNARPLTYVNDEEESVCTPLTRHI